MLCGFSKRMFISAPAALLCLASGGCATARPPAVPSDTIAEGVIPLYLSSRRALAMLRIGERPPVPVVFDTGTSGNGIDRSYAIGAGLRRAGAALVTDGSTGSSQEAMVVGLDQASLSGTRLGNPRAAAYDYREEDAVGIVGPNLFSGTLVYLEFGRARIRLRRKESSTIPSGPSTPYHAIGDGALPAVAVSLPGGATVMATLDSGANAPLSLPLAMADQLPLEDVPTVIGTSTSVSGTVEIRGARLRGEVRIGGVLLRNPDIIFMSEHANVGLPVIRQMTIVLDPEEERSWVLEPAALTPPQLATFAGRAGPRTIDFDRGKLVYRRDGRSPVPLTHIGSDLFENAATGDRFQFRRDSDRVTGFDLITADGQIAIFSWDE